MGEGTEQQRAKSLYLTTVSFGIGRGEQLFCGCMADGAYARHMEQAQDRQGRVSLSPEEQTAGLLQGLCQPQSPSEPVSALRPPVKAAL